MSGRRIVVEGRVQGVAFRAFTRDLATRLGLVGWVRNREDGTVEIEAAGEEESLEKLVEGVRRGPSLARVTRLTERPLDRAPAGTEFRIVYR